MSFLRTEVTDTYNNGMNDVDVADQLQNTYHIDRWMCKRKWWWAIWMWGVQVLLVNAFVLYKTLHPFIWKREKKQVLSQYEFCCQVVLEWLCSSEEKEDSSAEDESNHTRKCNEASTSSSSKKGKRVNDATLDPISGNLHIHLDNDFHYPIVPDMKNKPCCSLC